MDNRRKVPPPALVRTWIELLVAKGSQDIRAHAAKMLQGSFRDAEEIASYCAEHGFPWIIETRKE